MRAFGGVSECGNRISAANLLILFHSNYRSVLFLRYDHKTNNGFQKTDDGLMTTTVAYPIRCASSKFDYMWSVQNVGLYYLDYSCGFQRLRLEISLTRLLFRDIRSSFLLAKMAIVMYTKIWPLAQVWIFCLAQYSRRYIVLCGICLLRFSVSL